MENKFTIVTPGAPRTKPAHSSRLVNGHIMSWNKSTTDKNKLRKWLEDNITDEQRALITKDPEAEIHVTIYYYMPIPKSFSDSKRRLCEWGLIPHVHKPDCDNMQKFHSDVANGLLWPDDRQIVVSTDHKEYSTDPRVEYIIEVKGPRMDKKTEIVLGEFSKEDIDELGYIATAIYKGESDNDVDEIAELALKFGKKFVDIAKKLEKLEPKT